MNQGAAGTLNQYPNLIELIGLQGIAAWQESAIGSDESDGIEPLPAAGPDRMSICNDENLSQDETGDIAQVGTALAS